MSTLRETFIKELKDIYDVEHQIIEALPKAIKAAEHEELKNALDSHLEETRGHVERLENVFEMVGEPPKRKKCKGMEGLIAEGEELISEKEGDAALISALQKVEHYELAAYGSLSSWARLLDEEDAAGTLEETLNEESDADERLTELAESIINPEENEEDEEEDEGPSRKRAA
jgi:ferritin-like metal-binding protein YciE